jgi:hypothetical protein
MQFLEYCIDKCRDLDIQFLLHIDDDELLYVSEEYNNSLKHLILKKKWLHSRYTDLHFKNVEAVYDDNVDNAACFTTNSFIDCYLDHCRSYANGKSMGKIHSSLKPWGPHHFTAPTLKISMADAVVLHFDSCNFNRWQQKFINLSNISKKELQRIPFSYYKQSIQKIYDCEDKCSDSDESCSLCIDEMKSLWKSFTSSVNKKFIKQFNISKLLMKIKT